MTGTKNWTFSTYIDRRGTRHRDPYMVLILAPVDPQKTAPTWDDILMFVEEMLRVENWNDASLRRLPEMPGKLRRLNNVLMEFEGSPTTQIVSSKPRTKVTVDQFVT
jgi:hypothetical protein